MINRESRTELACSPDTFWRCWFDEEFNRAFYLNALGYRGVRLLEQREEPDRIFRRMQVHPSVGRAPEAVTKVIGTPSWIEEGTWFKSEGRMTLVYVPSVLAEKSRIALTLRCEPQGRGRSVRIAQMEISVRVPLLGRLIERSILDQMESGAKPLAGFLEQFARERGWVQAA